MKSKITLLLILSSGLLFFGPSIVLSQTANNGGPLFNNNSRREENVASRAAFQAEMKTKREEMGAKLNEMRADFKEKRDAFKEKLKTIKDERKKNLTEKIDNRMVTVNKNQTARMKKILDMLTEHISKLEKRLSAEKEKGQDVANVESLLATAKTAISDSLTIVESQAAKDYVFEITEEENLGQSIKGSYEALKEDLGIAQDSVVKAKKAVVDVYKAMQSLIKVSPTAVITP
jgi:hypothetical protein